MFKDSVTARVHPEWTIREADGSIWRDKKGIAWVNPYHHELWDYNIGVAEELVKMGFGEVQFDYIRFPGAVSEPAAAGVPRRRTDVSKPDAIAAYLKEAKARLNKLGVRSTADIFGLVTTVNGPLEVGQKWEKVSPNVDVVLPMVYPSHYPRGELGICASERRAVQGRSSRRSRGRTNAIRSSASQNQNTCARGCRRSRSASRRTAPRELEAQKKAVYDAGYDGWVLWNPGSIYDVFMPALEKTLVSRKKRSSRA